VDEHRFVCPLDGIVLAETEGHIVVIGDEMGDEIEDVASLGKLGQPSLRI